MDRDEANELFQDADWSFREGNYEKSLEILGELEREFGDNHRILNAKARALSGLMRYEEALAVCDQLLHVHGYDKIAPFREKLAKQIAETRHVAPLPEEEPAVAEVMEPEEADSADGYEGEIKTGRFRIKPLRLLALILISIGMWRGYVPYWLGGGLIVAYFVLKFAIRAALYRLFTVPFKLKGRALEGATATVHSVSPADPPTPSDEDEDEGPASSRYVWIDVTITPPEQSRGFTHWEPGELAIAPASLKLKSLDHHDKCSQVEELFIVGADGEQEDEGYKLAGPQRLRLRVGLPGKETETKFRFVYYFEVFGEFDAPSA